MDSEKKTLVIFDTNMLRHNENEAGFSYNFLDFSSTFRELEDFIGRYSLSEKIKIAVPKIVLEELIQQKFESFTTNIQILQDKVKPFADFNLVKVELPSREYDYRKDIGEKLDFHLSGQALILIDYPKIESFEKIIKKAIKRETPFSPSKAHKDHGFKDVVIWESILHCDQIKKFDKIIFMTQDLDFNNEYCTNEFARVFNKHFLMIGSKKQLFDEISNDYEISLSKDRYVAFAYSSYFREYLLQQCKNKTVLRLSNGDMTIDKIEVAQPFVRLEVIDDEGKDELEKWVIALLSIKAHNESGSVILSCEIKTTIDETLGLDSNSVDFQYELL